MSERVPLSEILSKTAVMIDADLANRLGSIPPSPESSAEDLHAEFYFSFLNELGADRIVEFLISVGGLVAQLPDEVREESLEHPVIGRDPHIQPEPEDPWFRPFLLTQQWLLHVLSGEWDWDESTQKHRASQARLPHWLIYSFCEISRRFVVAEPDAYDSASRARAFVRFDSSDHQTIAARWGCPVWQVESLLTGRPRTAEPVIFLPARVALRAPDESRTQFLARVIQEVTEQMLRQLLPMDEAGEELGQIVGSHNPRVRSPRLNITERAKQCARRVLGQKPSDGSSRQVQDDLLAALGFLKSPNR